MTTASSEAIELADLLRVGFDGPPAGFCRGDDPSGRSAAEIGAAARVAGFRTRVVDGRDAATLAGLFDAFGRVWDFGSHFGHNRDAFDEAMRDLDGPPRTPAAALLTVVDHGERILADEPEALAWLTDSLYFYREHYRDRDPAAGFGLLLCLPAEAIAGESQRWRAAGLDPVAVQVPGFRHEKD